MNNVLHLASNINVLPTLLELKNNPQLWNQYTCRTYFEGSPHQGIDDIWVRYNDFANWDPVNPHEFNQPHESIWYPAADKLPSIKILAHEIMYLVKGERLGGILITRIPPGGISKPHVDLGWHAEYYDKYALQLESHPQQAFCFEEGCFSARPGDLYWFNNQALHWVPNESPVDRITLIFCIRTNKGV